MVCCVLRGHPWWLELCGNIALVAAQQQHMLRPSLCCLELFSAALGRIGRMPYVDYVRHVHGAFEYFFLGAE